MAENTVSEIQTRIRERLAKGAGLIDLIEQHGMEIAYARDIDHVYLTIGKPVDTLALPVEDEMESLVLYDPENYEIRGFEFPGFLNRFYSLAPSNRLYQLIAEFIREGTDTVYIPGSRDRQQTEEALLELAVP